MKQLHVKIILWATGLVAAVVLTRVLRIVPVIGSTGADYLVTMYLIMLFTSLVYGTRLIFRASSSSSNNNHEDMNQEEQQQQLPATNDNNAITPARRRHQRLYFLDNLKVFLTAVVLTHHTQCAFGACGKGWFLGMGLYENWFTVASSLIVGLNQAYFMPMFFFISAYFVPTSYDRKGKHEFLIDKAKRYWIPAMLTSFTVLPVTMFVASRTTGQTFVYIPVAGPTWFLFWLLVFNYLYVTIREAATSSTSTIVPDSHTTNMSSAVATTDHASTTVATSPSGCEDEDPQEDMEAAPVATGETPTEADVAAGPETHSNERPIPCFWKRWLYYGAGICGVGMLVFILAVGGGSFYAMPLATGSFVNDLFMFGVGIVARRHDWLVIPDNNNNEDEGPSSSASSLSVAWPWIYVALLLEITAMVALGYYHYISSNDLVGLLYMILAGVYCVDMILVLLHFFQRWANTLNRFGSFLADAAYTVYLIHPLVVTGGTAVFVKVYNGMHGWEVIQFDDDGNVMSSSQLLGEGDGALALFTGWLVVLICSHLISWPLAWAIKKLPGLRLIL